MASVYAPDGKLTGNAMGVTFTDGLGTCSDEGLLTWFRSHGYKVVADGPDAPAQQQKPAPSSSPAQPRRKRGPKGGAEK